MFSFDGEVYESIILSQYSHIWTRGLANYRGKALTTGCNSFGECSFKTELLDMTTLRQGLKSDLGCKLPTLYICHVLDVIHLSHCIQSDRSNFRIHFVIKMLSTLNPTKAGLVAMIFSRTMKKLIEQSKFLIRCLD